MQPLFGGVALRHRSGGATGGVMGSTLGGLQGRELTGGIASP